MLARQDIYSVISQKPQTFVFPTLYQKTAAQNEEAILVSKQPCRSTCSIAAAISDAICVI